MKEKLVRTGEAGTRGSDVRARKLLTSASVMVKFHDLLVRLAPSTLLSCEDDTTPFIDTLTPAMPR